MVQASIHVDGIDTGVPDKLVCLSDHDFGRGSLASAAWSEDHLLISTQLEISEWLCEGFKPNQSGFEAICVVPEYLFGRKKHDFWPGLPARLLCRTYHRSIK